MTAAAKPGYNEMGVSLNEHEIRDLEFKDTTLAREYAEDKEGILDIKLVMNGKRKLNIEIQVLPYAYWEERSLFYLSKHFVEGFEKGNSYKLLDTTIHISILAFSLFEDGGWYSIIELRDRKTHRLYSDKMSLRMVQLSQLSKVTPEEQESEIYAWAKMISAKDWEVFRKMAERNEYMKAAVDEMEKINADEEMRYRYLMREKWEHDEATIRMFEREWGIIQGKTEDILELLADLGEVPEYLRKRILEQRDLQTLKEWHRTAARADSLEEFERNIE